MSGGLDPARHRPRDADVTNKDKKRLLELFDGTDTTRAWLNYSLPARA